MSFDLTSVTLHLMYGSQLLIINFFYFCPSGFLRKDVRRGRQRHLILATNQQIRTLAAAKRWNVDGTFKVVKRPFTQLFSIHCFVRRDNNIKLVPLCFVLMSLRKKKDYVEVFRELKGCLLDMVGVRCILHGS